MSPSRTLHVSGAQLAFTHPVKSRPLKRGTKPASSAASAEVAAATRRTRENRFMGQECPCHRINARRNQERGGPSLLRDNIPFAHTDHFREPRPRSSRKCSPAYGLSHRGGASRSRYPPPPCEANSSAGKVAQRQGRGFADVAFGPIRTRVAQVSIDAT